MNHITLALTMAVCYTCLTMSASANDSEGGTTATGGLEFLRNEYISMKSEDLFISTDLIRVEYTYKNTHFEDIEIEVAFPVQSPCGDYVGCLEAIEFQTWVNGEKIDWRPYFGQNIQSNSVCRSLWLQRNEIYNRNGYCFSTLSAQVLFDNSDCTSDGIELNNDDQQLVSELLSLEGQNECVTPSRLVQPVNPYEGTASPSYFWDPVIDAEDYVSMVRTQVFPANSLTKVVHEYRPDVGGGIPQWEIQEDGDLRFTADEWEILPRDGYFGYFGCTSWTEYSSAVLHWKDTWETWQVWNDLDVPIFQNWLSYVLVTGANWNGPIGHFRLEITTDGRQIVDTCFDGLERVSDTSLVFEATDFTPTENLSVTFHAPESMGD
ncbi:DUF4424 family protein [uncultured Psychrosphaera sp.]|uniref:DUF4424 family protein n=1 Tax=uncultured Psychrosphaera sp. TaxID=1403522 RepID=UPI0030F9B45D